MLRVFSGDPEFQAMGYFLFGLVVEKIQLRPHRVSVAGQGILKKERFHQISGSFDLAMPADSW